MPRAEHNPWQFAHIGLEFAGAAVVLALVGWWLDDKFDTAPWLAVIGASIGMIGGMYLFIKAALRANRDSAPPPHRPRRPRADVAPPEPEPPSEVPRP